jgi:RimJ/RimL family protein N-acetyltransferase
MTVLETPRLLLRELTPGDVDALLAVLSDPIAMPFYPEPFDRERTVQRIEWNLRNYAEHGFGLWAMIHKQDGRLIGDCGLTIQRVDGIDELEIGYHVLRSYWTCGLATEAAAACRDRAFDDLERQRVISWMHPDNRGSRRVAEKIGMRLEKETLDGQGRPAVVYAMPADDRRDRDG